MELQKKVPLSPDLSFASVHFLIIVKYVYLEHNLSLFICQLHCRPSSMAGLHIFEYR